MTRRLSKADQTLLVAVGLIVSAVIGGAAVYLYTTGYSTVFTSQQKAIQMVPSMQAQLRNHERIDWERDYRGRISSIIIDRSVE